MSRNGPDRLAANNLFTFVGATFFLSVCLSM